MLDLDIEQFWKDEELAHEDNRYQHSDSAMGHLIPLLADFNLTGCNFGPTVTV